MIHEKIDAAAPASDLSRYLWLLLPVAVLAVAIVWLLQTNPLQGFNNGAPPVEVTTRRHDGNIVLDVTDRGPGIAPGDVERLKQPFTRASAARTNAAGVAGAGLGLAIVDRIARLHGGTFDLLVREGGGTLARVTLPGAS